MSEHITEKAKKRVFASPYFVMVVLMLGVFMMGLDMYIFSPALVTIVGYFNTSYTWVAWTMTIYLLVSTAIMPLAGKLSDVFGRKRIFIAGVAVFTIGSVLSSLSWNIYSLIIFRAVQAVGAGIILPAALAAMSSSAPPDKLGKTMSGLMAMSTLAMIIGPAIGGYVIQNFGWRVIFYINVPIGILAILLALMIKESYGSVKHHIDVIGASLLAGGLAVFLLGLVRLETLPFTDITVFPLLVAGLLLGILFVQYEKHATEPILDVRLMFRGDILSLNLGFMMLFFCLVGVITYVPSFAQLVLHMGVLDSGALLMPLSISLFIFGLVGGVLVDKFGAKSVLVIWSIIRCIGFAGLTYCVTDSLSLAIMLFVIGVGVGGGTSVFTVALLSRTPGTEKGVSSAILMTFKGIGGIVGPVVGGYFLNQAQMQTETYSQAFSNIFLSTIVATIIGLVLIAYFVISTRKTSKPIASAPQIGVKQ